jgi:hypothetical protein
MVVRRAIAAQLLADRRRRPIKQRRDLPNARTTRTQHRDPLTFQQRQISAAPDIFSKSLRRDTTVLGPPPTGRWIAYIQSCSSMVST